jgi:hypothetical protein
VRITRSDDTDTFVSTLVPFVGEGLARDEAVAVVSPRLKLRALRSALGDLGDGVELYESESWYSSPSQAQARYRDLTDRHLADGRPWIRVVGEPPWTPRHVANLGEWIRYESLINLAFANTPATILCPYDRRSAPARAVADAARVHSDLFDGDALDANPEYVDAARFLLDGDAYGG